MKLNLTLWLQRLFPRRWRQSVHRTAATAVILGGGLGFVGSANGIEAIVNGSFELPSPMGWDAGFGVYSHTSSVYYEGPAPAGAGEFYGWDPGIVEPQMTTQTLNLAQGISQIDAGTAAYDFSAWMSSWTSDSNYTVLELSWNDSTSGNGNTLGTPVTFDGDDAFSAFLVGSADASGNADPGIAWTQDNWSLYQSMGNIPVGARSAVVSYSGVGNDAYLDLVSLDLPFDINAPTLQMEISRDTGAIKIMNNTGVAQDMKGYSILSADGALLEADATFLADSDANWIQFTEPGGAYDLSEGHLTTYSFATGTTIDLGNSWLAYYEDEGDITFEYLDGAGLLVEGEVIFSGNGGESFLFADIDFDGDVDSDDWTQFAAGLGEVFPDVSPALAYRSGDLTGDLANNHADFLAFVDAYDTVNGAGAFDQLFIPEPSALWLGAIGVLLISAKRHTDREVTA